MHELSITTTRNRRGPLSWLKRRRRFYETEVSDGNRVAYGRGPTLEASVAMAQRNWDAQFEICALAVTSFRQTGRDLYCRARGSARTDA